MGGTLREEREKSGGRSPGPHGLGSLLSSQASSPHSKAPSSQCGPWGHRREAGEIRSGRWEEPTQEEQERNGGRLPCPLGHRKAAGLPGEVPCPLRPEVGGTPVSRSEERRVGKECLRLCRSRWSPYH